MCGSCLGRSEIDRGLLFLAHSSGERETTNNSIALKIDKLMATALEEQEFMPNDTPIISTSPDIMGGTPVFAGTRVPVQTFPTVTREQVVAFLEEAGKQLVNTVA
jgi:uncharacterized protein (DUF433 family)